MPVMDLRDFLDVKAICDEGSFRKAAQVLGVAQPTLSNRVAYLEDKLGARLFERDRSRSRPTQLAELIAARAAVIGEDASLLAKDISRLAAGRTGTVRIGYGPAPGRILLNEVIARITTQLPELSISLTLGATHQLSRQLLGRELDIAVCHTFEVSHPSIVIEQELEVGNVVVAHPQHPMFRGRETALKDVILKVPMAIPVLEKRYSDLVLTGFGIDVERLPGSVICSDFELLIQLVTARPWYFTAGPEFAFRPELDSGKLRRLAAPVPFGHRVAVHTNRDALPLPAVAQVQQIVRDVVATLADSVARS
jgi:DNA-binding transcriptional LysR family regulator